MVKGWPERITLERELKQVEAAKRSLRLALRMFPGDPQLQALKREMDP